jgi:hypothetical protein
MEGVSAKILEQLNEHSIFGRILVLLCCTQITVIAYMSQVFFAELNMH